MSSASAVLVCVLNVLGRSASSMPPIELIEVPPPSVSHGAEAFVRHGGQTIYLITSSAVFREALSARSTCEDHGRPSLKKLASILVHEEWHVRHGDDERGAYEAQLMTLVRLGVAIDSAVFAGVRRSMLTVLKAQERAERPLALAVLE